MSKRSMKGLKRGIKLDFPRLAKMSITASTPLEMFRYFYLDRIISRDNKRILKKWVRNIHVKYVVLGGWLTLTLLYLVLINISNRYALSGYTLVSIQDRTSELQLQNMILLNRVADRESLSRVDKEASVMGLSDITHIMYIK